MNPPIGAHASILKELRKKSLAAYGIDIQSLTKPHQDAVVPTEDAVRALASTANEHRALAVQSEHHLTRIE